MMCTLGKTKSVCARVHLAPAKKAQYKNLGESGSLHVASAVNLVILHLH